MAVEMHPSFVQGARGGPGSFVPLTGRFSSIGSVLEHKMAIMESL